MCRWPMDRSIDGLEQGGVFFPLWCLQKGGGEGCGRIIRLCIVIAASLLRLLFGREDGGWKRCGILRLLGERSVFL